MTADSVIRNNNASTVCENTIKDNFSGKEPAECTLPSAKTIGTDYNFKQQIVWRNAVGFLVLHLACVWGCVLMLRGLVAWKTILWCLFTMYFITEGVTIGAHRLYTHRSFSAKPILKVLLLLAITASGQNSLFIWCRDHRLHHRYSDTDADPHNAKRGFFFSHIGWLMTKKHPYVIELGKKIDLSDLQADWMVMFQKKYYYPLYLVFAVLIPVWIPVYFWKESWYNSLFVAYFVRYIMQLNGTWLVNSLAHLYGTRPYDKDLQPVESWFVSMISLGEGWHNYHHAFPWDYKAAELTMHFNQSASLIRFFERIGWAYDLKTASQDMVNKRIQRTGDGTHYELGNDEDRSAVTAPGILHPLNPFYTAKYKDPDSSLKEEGLPLFHIDDVLISDDSCRKRRVGDSKNKHFNL